MVSGALRAGVSSFCSTKGSALNSNRIELFAGDVAASSQKQATKRITAHIAGRDARSIARGNKKDWKQERSGGPADQLFFAVAEQSRSAGVDATDLQLRIGDQQGFLHGAQNIIHVLLSPLARHGGSQHARGRPEAIPLGIAPLALAPVIFKSEEAEPASRHFYRNQNCRLRRIFIRRR